MHLSDEDIVRMLDCEVSPAEADAMRGHLRGCAECGMRVVAGQRALDGAGEIFGLPSVPSVALRQRLEREMRREKPVRRWVWAASVAACALFVAVLFGELGREAVTAMRHDAGSVPNLSLTPGAIRPVTLHEICSAADADDDLDPTVPAPLQNAVFREYGIAGAEGKYQIDYLVNPQLGGTDDIRNLWPQAYQGGVWNARAKDLLEERLHQMVCERTIDLETAQKAISTDWIAAYKKYVRAPRI